MLILSHPTGTTGESAVHQHLCFESGGIRQLGWRLDIPFCYPLSPCGPQDIAGSQIFILGLTEQILGSAVSLLWC
jgi:hypothetical protein